MIAAMTFKAIRLDSGGGLSATLLPGVGMVAVSLVFADGEYLDQRSGISEYVEHASTMGLPILYPWANRLARDSWKFDGKQVMIETDGYRIKRDENGYPIHGTLAASSLWQVGEAEADEDLGSASVRATLDFGEHPGLLETFPFPHRLELEYRVTGDELKVTTTVTPTGEVAVPLAYGFHPYLTLPGGNRESWRVRLPGMLALETDRRHIPTGNTHLDRASDELLGQRDLDDAFSGVTEGAEFSVSNDETAITMRFDRGYPAAQVFSPAGADFICFEPMKSPVNALITGRDLASVQPGESDIAEFTIRIGPPPGESPSSPPDPIEEAAPTAIGATALPPAAGTQTDRRFRLDPGRDPVDEVRRVARGRADSAVSGLREADSDTRAAAVHTARKDMKKMRALLRLVRGGMGKRSYRVENGRFRDAAARLSDARDAEVLAGTLESLMDRYPQDGPSLETLRDQLDQRRREAAGHAGEDEVERQVSEAADEIAAGRDSIDSWKLKASGWELFEPGLRRSYRDGRRALAEVEVEPVPEATHEFRKRVKDHWYAMRLLRDAWPAGLDGVIDEAGLLSDLLGDYNDLSVLRAEIEDGQGDEDFSTLSRVASGRQHELLTAALPIARRLYAERPSAFTARLGAYWSVGGEADADPPGPDGAPDPD
jgi:galactose mutarotase-like enzyme/CHAD domain-containing protein